MKYNQMKRLRQFGSIILSGLISQWAFAASNIDSIDKYAWSTNSGWVNHNDTNGGVTVYDDHLEGYAWAENVGWIRLGTYTDGNTHTYTNTSTDYGINNDGSGNLSGYAWSSNVGWINFNPDDSQVTINTTTGDFDGYAWSENVGWIHFKNISNPAYKVRYNVLNAPIFTSTALTSINKDVPYNYSITTTDVDVGDSLTITTPIKPTWLSLTDNGDGTATLSGTPTAAGTYNVTLRVTDGTTNADQSFTITVNTTNNPPTFTSTAITSINKDAPYNYSITTTDVDGDSLTITAPTKPTWLSLTDNGDGTGTLTGTPIEAGTYNVTLRVIDGTANVDQSFTITVNTTINNPPTFTSIAVTAVNQNSPYAYNITTNDPDGDNLVINAPTKPTWLNLTDNGNGTATLNGTPTATGTYSVTLQVTDGTVTVDQSFTITVNDSTANNPPTFTSIAMTAVNQNVLYTYNIVTTDIDTDDSLLISAPTKPTWLSLTDSGNGRGTLTGTPTNNEVGTHAVILRVNDGTVNVDQGFMLTVKKTVNHPPTFTSTAMTSINPDDFYAYNIITKDIDTSDSLVISAPTKPTWLNLTDNGNGTGALSGTPTNREVGTHKVTLRVNDGTIDVEQGFTLTVNQTVNNPPTFLSTPMTAVNKDVNYTYNIITKDIDTDDSLLISAPTKPTWLSLTDSGNGRGTLTGTPTNREVGTHDVILRVSDGMVNVDQIFTLKVNKTVNHLPTFIGTAMTAVNQDVLYAYYIITEDIDTTDNLVISAPIKPTWLSLTDNGDGTGALSGTPTNAEAGEHQVTLRVNDGTIDVDQSFTITVNQTDAVLEFISTAMTTVNQDVFYTYNIITKHNLDNSDSLVISAPTKPTWLSLTDSGNGRGTLNGTPTNREVGTHEVTLFVTDGTVSVKQNFTITVNKTANNAPTFTSTAVTAAHQDALYSYAITTDDPDMSDSLTFAAVAPAWLSLTATGNGTATLSGTPTKVRTYDVTLQVSDGTASADQKFVITMDDDDSVITVDDKVVKDEVSGFTSSPLTSVDKNTLYRYDITATDANSEAQLALTAPLKPAWLTLTDNDDGTASLTGTPTETEIGFHEVILQVNNGSENLEQKFTVSVNDVKLLSNLSLKSAGGSITNTARKTVESQPAAPADEYEFPDGLVSFEVEILTGKSVVVSTIYENLHELQDNFVYQKYGPTIPGDPTSVGWYTFENVTFELVDTIDGEKVVQANLTLTDGELGDDTGVDGIIVDDGGIAIDTSASPTDSSSDIINISCASQDDSTSQSCEINEQEFIDPVVVEEDVTVADSTFENDVENHGVISDSTIGQGATLNGGTLTGSITNEGVIADVNFVGDELSGGTLAGTVTNNSQVGTIYNVYLADDSTIIDGKVGGYIKCAIDGVTQSVQLTDGTSIIGCDLAGKIDGSKNGQAKIGEAEIKPDTTLSNVCLTPTVKYDPNTVTLGAGVITPTNFDNPTPQDFCINPSQIQLWDSGDVIGVETKAFSTFKVEHVAAIPAAVINNIIAAQLAEFTKISLSGMTSAQFNSLLVNSLTGLTSANMAGFSPEVIGQFVPTHLNALNTKRFQQMPSQDISKLLTNFDGDKITPANVESFVPSDWQLDSETGELTAPIDAKLTLRALPTPEDLPTAVELPPDMVDLNEGFGLGGAGTPMISGLTDAIENADIGTLSPSQTTEGIFQVESHEAKYSFIPDVDAISKVGVSQRNQKPGGLSIGNGGFYRLTTPDAIQIPFIPAPQNPIALSETIGDNTVIMGNSGDVFMELSDQNRRGKTRQVLIFDPFIEPGIDDSCVEIIWGQFACDEFDDLRSSKRGLRQRVQRRKIKYPDGTAQTIYPTVLSPDVFIKEGFKFEGVENIVFNTNGTFYVVYEGKPYLIIPSFEVQSEELSEGKSVEPSIELKEGGQIRYTIPFAYQNIETRRHSKRGKTREVLIFDPFIEPAPDDMCTEPVPGEIICDFDDFF